MNDTEARKFTFEELSVWDWYDGIVRATGVCLHRPYFITLAAWDIAGRRKAYLLTELPLSLADKLKSLAADSESPDTNQEAWNSFTQLYENYLRGYTGTLYISFDEPQAGQEISSRIIETKHLRELRNYEMERAFSDAACRYWFDLVADT